MDNVKLKTERQEVITTYNLLTEIQTSKIRTQIQNKMATKMEVEDSKKRPRSEASISETDASLLEDSKDTESIDKSKTKEDTAVGKKETSEKIEAQSKNASYAATPKSKPKQKESTRSKKKAKRGKFEKETDGEWEDLSFQESIQLQLKDISASLANLVNRMELKNEFSKMFDAKLDKLMSTMKEEIIKSVTHRIEVLEGELHDSQVKNDKLTKQVKSVEDKLKDKIDTIENMKTESDNQKQDIERLQFALEDSDRAFYGRTNDLEQYSRRNNIRIWGIRETEDNEDAQTTIDKVVMVLNEKLRTNLTTYDIDIAHRIGKSRKTESQEDAL